MICLRRPYHFEFSKRCLPQILLGLFSNTLSQMDSYIQRDSQWDEVPFPADNYWFKVKKETPNQYVRSAPVFPLTLNKADWIKTISGTKMFAPEGSKASLK